jgi:hypothetical protein
MQKIDSDFFVFEVSPTPAGGVLILVSNVAVKLSTFYSTEKLAATATLFDSCLIQNVSPQIIEAYLSQNRTTPIKNLNFFETNSLSQSFLYAQKIIEANGEIIDFRVIRSTHNRSILIYGGNKIDEQSVCIDGPTDVVKDYFLIQQ